MSRVQTSLLVRHLPGVLSDEEKVDLLCHFGAISVQTMGIHGPMKHCAFARFPSPEAAERGLKRLHQLEVLGCRLVVEIAKERTKNIVSDNLMKKPEAEVDTKSEAKDEVKNDTVPSRVDEAFGKHNITYPKKPTLCYIYPPPTVSTLTNIANTLASHFKFYTQVLHLMNKMNLPCPFGAVTPSPPLALEKSDRDVVKRKYTETGEIEEVEMEYASTEESEMESDSEIKDKVKEKQDKGVKKTLKRPKKRLRVAQQPMPVVLKPAVAHNPSEVFDATSNVKPTQIQFNISERDIYEQLEKTRMDEEKRKSEEQAAAAVTIQSGFGKVEPLRKEEVTTEVTKPDVDYKIDRSLFLSKKDIVEGRLKENQFKDFSVFKKYSSGEVTSRLYIKNLTKHTSEQNLVNLFGSFIDWSKDLAVETFDVRVMKEGRMKGQAFVTLPNDEQANKIVQSCNGFILNSKPIVIQFARSAKAKQVDKPAE